MFVDDCCIFDLQRKKNKADAADAGSCSSSIIINTNATNFNQLQTDVLIETC